VGPDFGYVNSVRTRVCGRGAEMELSEIREGELSELAFFRLPVDSGRERERNPRKELEVDCEGW